MNKVTIKKMPFVLNGDTIKVGEELFFNAKDINNKLFNINDLKGKKIISLFPAINTRICDQQTHKIFQLALLNPNVNFLSVSNDSVEVIKQWCLSKNITNINIVSDLELKEFANKSRALIVKIAQLVRGFILLDENNIVLDIALNKEIAEEPNYEKLDNWIKQYF